MATLGVDAEVSRYVDTMRMPLKGTLAYVYAALRVLARYRPRHLRITVEFGTIEQAVFLASSANTSTYGGAIEIAPDAVPTDGLLDLCIIDRVSKLRAFSILPMVLMRRHTSSEFVHFTQTKQLRIESDEELEVWADGEFIAGTPVDISVARRALRVLVPKDGKSSGKTAGLAKGGKGPMMSPGKVGVNCGGDEPIAPAAAPRYREGNAGGLGVIMLHGLTASPTEVEPIAAYLEQVQPEL